MEGPNFYELGASSSRLLAAAAAKAEMAIFVHTHTHSFLSLCSSTELEAQPCWNMTTTT